MQSGAKKPSLKKGYPFNRRQLILFIPVCCCVILGTVFINCTKKAYTQPETSYISFSGESAKFILSQSGKSVPIYCSSQDFPGVRRVVKDMQTDIGRVTGSKPVLSLDQIPSAARVIVVGTIGKSPIIENLFKEKNLDVTLVSGKRESFLIKVLDNPYPGVEQALVIAGSDKRGTIYGVYDLSRKIGVSPWYWWADVPVKKHADIFVTLDQYIQGEPAVKYRGIFINDEAPALSGWAFEKFGGFNHRFYQKVFELILRLKGNFLWPAMWGRAFYVDDPRNPELADEYGVVIGTSHHEPMMRAHAEWSMFGEGPWNYEKNEKRLKAFWREGIERMNDYESIITLAMRGDGDEPMSEEANIALLQKIVRDQREIIKDVTHKDITTIPQVWALYKEVQEYYDKGMRVPEDITLLLCDDNWGNIRKLPRLDEKARPGGYGIYYHYDYVGGPRNYKWLNTNQISRVWEQMHLAYRYGARRIWIVNVGDIKPMEFPISFFLDYAWDPGKWPAERLPEYGRQWAEAQFGPKFAQEIAEILDTYTRYNSRRKPELLSPDTYSLINYREAERIMEDYKALEEKARVIYEAIPAADKDAYYQLVLHPVQACSNLNELNVITGKNRMYAGQGRSATNELAQQAAVLFARDAEITDYYNNQLAGGKWHHMMDQTHIGYTYWQQPDENAMPEVQTIDLPEEAQMGIALQGSDHWWPQEKGEAHLPDFDPFNDQSYYIDIFNRGKTVFDYDIQPGASWMKLSQAKGRVETETRIWVSINWPDVPAGENQIPLTINGAGKQVIVKVTVRNPVSLEQKLNNCFIESNRYISIEAAHYTRAIETNQVTWQCIPGLGRTLSAMTPFPVTMPARSAYGNSPRLEYNLYLFNSGQIEVEAFLSPTLNFHNTQGLRYGISFDDQEVQIVNMHTGRTFQDWEESVRNNITVTISTHQLQKPGKHILKFWAVDPAVVLQKLVVKTGRLAPSYLGPPESIRISE